MPLSLIAIAAVLAGLGLEIFGVRWVTTLHEQIPDAIQADVLLRRLRLGPVRPGRPDSGRPAAGAAYRD